MTVKTAAEVPSDVHKRCSLVLYGMSLSKTKRNCIESNSDANHVEMRREVSEYECPLSCIVTVHFALGQCVARNSTMCLFSLSLYGCGQVIQLNDFASCTVLDSLCSFWLNGNPRARLIAG